MQFDPTAPSYGQVFHNGSAQPFLPDGMRKVLFLGYGYRWLRPRDNMTVAHYMERSGPIRRQVTVRTINSN